MRIGTALQHLLFWKRLDSLASVGWLCISFRDIDNTFDMSIKKKEKLSGREDLTAWPRFTVL